MIAVDSHSSTFRFGALVWARLVVLCSAILIEGMNLSSVSIQLPAIQRELALRPDQAQLVASIFLTAYAGFLLLGGKCADHWGARRTFLIGMSLFGSASVVTALACSAFQMIAARAGQGMGVAITAPAAVALIATEFPSGAPRNRALGVLSAAGAVGFCLGVVAGGLLTERLGWRWAFGVYVPLSALILLAALRVLKSSTHRAPGRIPWVPAMIVTSGLMMAVYAAGRTGTASLRETAGVGLFGLMLIGIFLMMQSISPVPLLPPELLARPRMASACIAVSGGFAGITGGTFLLARMIQEHQGYSALAAGLAFLPQVATVGFLSTPAAKLANRYEGTLLVMVGLAVVAFGQLMYTRVETSGYMAAFLPATAIVGAGIAILYPAAAILAASSARPHEQGIASGILTTCQQAGNALGVAVTAGVEVAMGRSSPALQTCCIFPVLALGLCLLRSRAARERH